jgi:hypothetical protein
MNTDYILYNQNILALSIKFELKWIDVSFKKNGSMLFEAARVDVLHASKVHLKQINFRFFLGGLEHPIFGANFGGFTRTYNVCVSICPACHIHASQLVRRESTWDVVLGHYLVPTRGM